MKKCDRAQRIYPAGKESLRIPNFVWLLGLHVNIYLVTFNLFSHPSFTKIPQKNALILVLWKLNTVYFKTLISSLMKGRLFVHFWIPKFIYECNHCDALLGISPYSNHVLHTGEISVTCFHLCYWWSAMQRGTEKTVSDWWIRIWTHHEWVYASCIESPCKLMEFLT